jgi:thiamine pyrophosphate-dependent acetolactate synthase large subunit-like protein
MTSHAIKGSDIFIRALENEGVEYVFGVPGKENVDMLESPPDLVHQGGGDPP